MITDPTAGTMISDIQKTIEEVKALDTSQGVSMLLASNASNEKVRVAVGGKIALRILRNIEKEFLAAQESWKKVAGDLTQGEQKS